MSVMRDQKILFGGHDLTGVMNAVSLEYAADSLENTVFGDDTHSFEGGLKTAAASLQGYFDAAKDKVIYDRMGAAGNVLSIASAGLAGSSAYSFVAMAGSYTPGGSVGELFSFSLEAATQGKLVRGTVMDNITGLDETDDGEIRQLSAVSADQKLYAILHVLDADGDTPTLDVIIQRDNSGGFGTPATAATFTQMTEAGSQWQEVDGAITDDYFRGQFTIGGTGAAFDFILILAIG